MDSVSKKRKTEQEKYKKTVKTLKSKLNVQTFNKIKYLNQDIKRKQLSIKAKDATIVLLRKQLRETEVGVMQTKLVKEQRKHNRLKRSYKRKRKNKNSKTVPLVKYTQLKEEIKKKDEIIRSLELEKSELEEQLAEQQTETDTNTLKDKKTYGVPMRMLVYDSVINQVPTENIPALIESHAKRRSEVLSSVPHRNTVEQMAHELDTIADLKICINRCTD